MIEINFLTLASGSKGNCYILQNNDECIIIECGMPFLEVKKALDFDIDKIKCVLCSHEHLDHAKYLHEYVKAGIPICASQGTLDYFNIKNIDGLRCGYWYKFGEFYITPFSVQHDCNEPYGFLVRHDEIGTMLFATDTEYIRYDFSKLKLDHIAIECNYKKEIIEESENKSLTARVKKSHMEMETCKEFLIKNTSPLLKNVVLLHLSDKNSDSKLFKEEIETILGQDAKVFIADKGLEVTIDKYNF